MLPLIKAKGKILALLAVVLAASLLVAGFAYHVASTSKGAPVAQSTPTSIPIPSPTATLPATATAGRTSTPTPTPTISPTANPATILGTDGIPPSFQPGLSWVRIAYPTCGAGTKGSQLQQTIQNLHSQGVHSLVITCQTSNLSHLLDTQPLQDIAQSGADAVQCGNEEMKYDPGVTPYVTPANFAKYYDLCQRIIHEVRPGIPTIVGALDPHVGGVDYQPLVDQVNYLNQMQSAMNTSVHPGGHWNWRTQIVGLIDSWHNGYPNQYVNSLQGLFVFWAQQFGVNLNSGALGKHLWVVEGTGCFKGCGIDQNSSYQVAVSHILTLTTDVQTTMRYHVPFFYFSTRDFALGGVLWPMGILDLKGRSKPIRQDLPMGARTLLMSCPNGQVRVADQEKLLASMYRGCRLPGNYMSVLTS